ncbi:Trichothecene 3-O-acetyltransferase [Fusarium agapanthi]|uniref:Trichothecene 3-O-acetyltransferase n=1 Tax=Fusarium agapanthi TaxID=1803897 RepID=A0A9P5EDC1_9HYPO|nr:Trichothecene 3-O-acetyltransferase [Fusarium agapanthi]
MPKQHVYPLHPLGWENDPEEERFKVTTLDYLTVCSYNNYALFFKPQDPEKERTAEILKAGLERTLAQARHYCGTIEKDPGGGHSFTNAVTLGDLEQWSVPPMTYGEKPEAHPDNSPVVSAFKANFIRGGLVFNIHHHHYTNDFMDWAGLVHQLAENCYADVNGTKHPNWDPLNLDVSRLIKQEPPEDQKIDGPAPPERHPAHQVGVSLLFHLPKSKAAELKAKAEHGYRHTMPSRPLSGVTSRVPPRIQHNVMFAVTSPTAPVTQPAIAQIMSELLLSELASYIRRLTNSITQENFDKTLEMVATIRDKTSLNTRVDEQPPLSILQTDHRDANITSADFGFAKPATYRHLLDRITEGVIIVYPPRDPSPESDEGCEFAIFYEKRLAQNLINDGEWSEYFEYRGVDADDASEAKKANGTNGTNGVNGSS